MSLRIGSIDVFFQAMRTSRSVSIGVLLPVTRTGFVCRLSLSENLRVLVRVIVFFGASPRVPTYYYMGISMEETLRFGYSKELHQESRAIYGETLHSLGQWESEHKIIHALAISLHTSGKKRAAL